MPLTFGIQAKKNWLVLLFDPHARIMNMPLNIIIGKVKKKKQINHIDINVSFIPYFHPLVFGILVTLVA